MNLETKIKKISRLSEEIIRPEELKIFLEKGIPLKHYIGFEISGLAHLGTALFTSIKIKDFQECGIETNIFLADWHSWINEKLGGNLEVIKTYGVNYFKEVFNITLKSLGAQPVNFILASEMYSQSEVYWQTLIEISKLTTLSRAKRSLDILGRKLGQEVDMAKLIYPLMQVADIFVGGFNFVHAGIDQRKAHVIARQVALKIKISPLRFKNKKLKPIIFHQPLLMSIGKPPIIPQNEEELDKIKTEIKMSKSKPEGCIFIHDSPQDIEKKIIKAFCPPENTFYNPILNLVELIIFPLKNQFKVKKIDSSTQIYENINQLKNDYAQGLIHPLDLKESVIDNLKEILKPIHQYFAEGYGLRLKKTIEDLIQK